MLRTTLLIEPDREQIMRIWRKQSKLYGTLDLWVPLEQILFMLSAVLRLLCLMLYVVGMKRHGIWRKYVLEKKIVLESHVPPFLCFENVDRF